MNRTSLATFGLAWAAAVAVLAAGCTLTHSLDGYSSDYGLTDAQADAGDDADAVCIGAPEILLPTNKEVVGATMRVQVSAPSCIANMIIYIDSQIALHVVGNTSDSTFPVGVGTHTVNVNGWAHSDVAHSSEKITVTRTQ